MFYLVCRDAEERINLIHYLKQNQIHAVFHYLCLHDSPYFQEKHDGREMPNAKKFEKCLVRLPLWVEMKEQQVQSVINQTLKFYRSK